MSVRLTNKSFSFASFCLDGHQHVHAAKNVMDVFRSVLKKYGIKKYRVPFETKFENSDWIVPDSRVQFYRQIQNELKISEHEQVPFIGYSIMGNVFVFVKIPHVALMIPRLDQSYKPLKNKPLNIALIWKRL